MAKIYTGDKIDIIKEKKAEKEIIKDKPKEKQQRLPVKKKYTQDWHKYNLAKTHEKQLFYHLLYELCSIIPEPRYEFGRPPIRIRDLVFSSGLKLYNNFSGRKVSSDLKHAQGAGYIKTHPHFNTITEFFGCPATYDLLQRILIISAMPLKHLEDKYSIDSSGFGSYSRERWQRVKWTKKGKTKCFKNYLKGHILIGTKTNIICNCEITPENFADIKQAPMVLLKAKPNFNFNNAEFSGDKAYGSKMLYRLIKSLGLIPYIPFQKRIKQPTEDAPEIWNKMFLMFRDNKDEWKEHYHQRSNVETVFGMVKVRLGEHLRCKNYHAQRNELMMKFIAHNITCLVQEIFERNININFKKCSEEFVDQKVSDEYKTRDGKKVANEDF